MLTSHLKFATRHGQRLEVSPALAEGSEVTSRIGQRRTWQHLEVSPVLTSSILADVPGRMDRLADKYSS